MLETVKGVLCVLCVLEVINCVLWVLEVVIYVLEVLESIRCIPLSMLEAMEGVLCLLEVPEVPEVMYCVLHCMLEAVDRICYVLEGCAVCCVLLHMPEAMESVHHVRNLLEVVLHVL